MSDRPTPSPDLLAANARLLALRAAYRQGTLAQVNGQWALAGRAGDGAEQGSEPVVSEDGAAADSDVSGEDEAGAGPAGAESVGTAAASRLPPGTAAAPAPAEPTGGDRADPDAGPALPALLAAVSPHLGWDSAAVSGHLRRQRPTAPEKPAAADVGVAPAVRPGPDAVHVQAAVSAGGDYGHCGLAVGGSGRIRPEAVTGAEPVGPAAAAAPGAAPFRLETAASAGNDETAPGTAGCGGGRDSAVPASRAADRGDAETAPTPLKPPADRPAQKRAGQPARGEAQKNQGSIQKRQSAVALHPDLALALLRAELVTPARLWLLLRRLDGDGRGWLAKTAVQAALTEQDSETYLCTPRYLRQLLARALGLGRLRGRLVAIPAEILLAPIGDVRAHFYATFHSSRGEEAAPVSRETLRDLSGASPRTQQSYEARAGVASEPCVALGPAVASVDPQAAAWRYGRAGFTFIDHQGRHGAAGRAYYARRLPNRYRGPHARGKKPRRLNRQLAGLCLIGDAGNGRADWNRRRKYWPDGAGATRAWLRSSGETAVYWPGRGSSDGVVVWLERPSLTV